MPPRRARQRRTPERKPPRELPYSGRNVRFFVLGIAVISLGYFCLSRPPVDGFMSLTLAPLLLVIGYCVLIPMALLSNNKSETSDAAEDANT
ncbi:MAG: hypothetical protein QGG64_09835 [Candidatus Latescibacteria bacterium]|jgi:hypothetical protein|nr:hypothetical protein [Candidatus Latescibacterota bacterium]